MSLSGSTAPHPPFLERGDFARRTVGAKNNLFAVIVKCVERMEKFLLALLTLTQKLYIIYHKHINGAKLALETNYVALFDCPDESVDEIFTAKELNYRVIKPSGRLEANSLKKMGFAQP